jgi:hypothetical protein
VSENGGHMCGIMRACVWHNGGHNVWHNEGIMRACVWHNEGIMRAYVWHNEGICVA